ncbi:uncharacterized protein UTRI_06504 [Ustilago trichophora]|uniref:Zn(2)-C6 fungal-type domain-containing protein n=1 Tax=Ustilago trichophora TaxID=86804 RepID=A0A5C3EL64_9BASI|nr:uncharacterized protein UTRI_06504 [Ustilago trichophora]
MSKPSSSMSPSDPKSNANDSGRIRSSRACLHCSRRKVKCDGLQPCNNCSKDSVACEYGAQKKRGPPKGCDPRGGRRKKVQESPSQGTLSTKSTPAKRKAPSSSTTDPANDARKSNANHPPSANKKPSTSQKRPNSPLSHLDFGAGHQDTAHTALHSSDRAIPSPSQSIIASLTARPSSDARYASEERPAISSHLPSSSYTHHDTHPSWSRPAYPQHGASSPPLPRRSSQLAGSTGGAFASTSASHPFTTNTYASQHASTNLNQHYLQPQHPQHPQQQQQQHHNDFHPSDHPWPSSSSDTRFSHQHAALTPHHFDAYPLQGSFRDHHRSSPLASHRSMLPPHTSNHTSSDPASQSITDRAAAVLPSGRSNTAASTSTFPSPRSYPSRSLYDSPATRHPTGISPYDRTSTVPSTSTLSSRHPVSASRLTEPSSNPAPAGVQTATSSSHSTGVNPSPAFTGASHGYSPSSTAMPHRPWYNGSQPPSPRDPASIPRSQISSPGAHWLDYHVRPSSAAANHPYSSSSSSKVHLEDRLPPHILQRLLDIYQVFVHPHWPIIYLPSVTSLHSLKRSRPIVFEAILAVASNTFDAYLDATADDDHPSANPVMELLYAESPQGSEPSWKSNELRDHFVQRVKTRIFEGKFAQDIGTIQAAILISVIELGCGNTSSAFQFGGIACRMALDMNLHRCTLPASTVSSSGAHEERGHHDSASAQHNEDSSKTDPRRPGALFQERVRVFWACFILDKILSTALDKPAQLRSAEIETDWPSIQEADEYDLWINETTRKFVEKNQQPRLEGVKVHALSSFKAWAEVMAILERILEEVYSPQAKRDRRRTKGASDYEALLRLNDRLSKWRANLPSHLKWSGTWTSPELLSSVPSRNGSADRKESDAHRGLPPQILTMRSWYCICLILLHRPRVPKLLEGPKERSGTISEEPQDDAAAETDDVSSTEKGKKNGAQPTKKGAQSITKDKCPEPAGLDICNAAAKEVCDILHVYGSSFRIRKISSSWVYLIFQSATIHAALAASKSVVAFKARQSSIWSRRGSKMPLHELGTSTGDGQHDLGAADGEDADVHAGSSDAEAHHVNEAELEGSSELVKTSALYLAECVRYLKRIGPTWQSASNHVAVLRNLCIASAQARPLSPSLPPVAAAHLSANGQGQVSGMQGHQNSALKHESHEGFTNAHQLLSTAGVPAQIPQSHDGPIVPGQDERVDPHPHLDPTTSHVPLGLSTNTTATANTDQSNLAPPPQPQSAAHFLKPQSYDSILPDPHQMQQQPVYPINANDAAFWASMPVASEGYNEWDEFFKAFNPSAGSNVPNYHPTAAVDLITALQDPNRLLSGFSQQQHHHQHHQHHQHQ